MIKNTTYFDNGSRFDTYKFKKGGMVKVLVKKDGKPHQVIRFDKITGRNFSPKENDTP